MAMAAMADREANVTEVAQGLSVARTTLYLYLRGCPETNVQQINRLEASKSMARSRLSSKSVLSLATHMT
jgi:hypothetical protein